MSSVLLAMSLGACGAAPASHEEQAVMVPVAAFYASFNSDFTGDAEFAAPEWNHINPLGGRTQGKEAVLRETRAVHATFLKGTTDTIKSADVRFADSNAAVVTVISQTSPYALPGQDKATVHNQIRTFVVAKRSGKWLIIQDHNTEIAAPPPA